MAQHLAELMAAAGTDALVIFGITGDLARQMTFRALYRLERRELLDFPIIGVSRRELADGELRDRAREAISEGEPELDEAVFERLAKRLSYIRGDLTEADLYDRVRDRLEQAEQPAFYLETPPTLFEAVVDGLAGAGALTQQARVLVEKPFGYDLPSARELWRRPRAPMPTPCTRPGWRSSGRSRTPTRSAACAASTRGTATTTASPRTRRPRPS